MRVIRLKTYKFYGTFYTIFKIPMINSDFLLAAVGHFSFGLSAISFAMRSLLWLRIVATVSLLLSLAYNLMVPQVYWLVVWWIAVFIVINVAQLIILIYQNNEIQLSHKLGLIRAHSFPGMSSRAFLKLYEQANIQSFDQDTVVVEMGGATTGLSLITKGNVVETLATGENRRIVNGQFFGDLTLVQPSSLIASPTLCVANKETEIAYWTYEALATLFKKNERIKSGVFQAMSYALATKHTMRLS